MKAYSRLLLMMLIAILAKVSCAESVGYFALDNGYRWDRISNRVTLGGPRFGPRGSTQKLRDINSYQIGGRGLLSFCGCTFLKGEGHYGWTGQGSYSEGGFFGNTSGHTYDGKGALGYYISMAPSIWIAPVIGYSYDALNLKGKDIHTDINSCRFHLSDINAHQRFHGPFIGFDALFEICGCYDFVFGYEFHFAKWHGQRLIDGREYDDSTLFGLTTAFSNKRTINNVYGQVLTFDLGYELCDCWRLGLNLKYQFYEGESGKYKQTKRPILPLITYAKIDGLRWLSFASTVTLGTTF